MNFATYRERKFKVNMRGLIFTEFMEMVEDKFSYEVLDEIITSSELPSGGVYTSVGSYPHQEIVTLVVGLSHKTKIPVPQLLEVFGAHLFQVFKKNYSHFFGHTNSTFQFLESIEDYIHVEVKKLYPDAELPKFVSNRPDEKTLVLVYMSDRSMGDLAKGLINSTIEHFKENISTATEQLNENGTEIKFTLVKND